MSRSDLRGCNGFLARLQPTRQARATETFWLGAFWDAADPMRGKSSRPTTSVTFWLIFPPSFPLRYEKRVRKSTPRLAIPQSYRHTTDEDRAYTAARRPRPLREQAVLHRPGGRALGRTSSRTPSADDIKVRLDNILELLEKTFPTSSRACCRASTPARTSTRRTSPG